MKNEILITRNLCKSYGGFTALQPTNISIRMGEILGLVGKNGAGKTTLMKIVTGQTVPTGGELELFGATTSKQLEYARKGIGAIVETPCFYSYMTARQNLEYYRIQRGITGKQAVQEALEAVSLTDTGSKKFSDFSLGMKQRLGLALALMNHPDFLILDEPVNGLDPVGIVEIRELLLALNREKHITVLISSHILSEMQNLATSYAFIHQGKIIKQLTAKELQNNCRQYLRLAVDDEARTAAVLERHFSGLQYGVEADRSIHISNYLDKAAEITNVLVNNKIQLYSLETRGTKLEEYFISLVGGNHNA